MPVSCTAAASRAPTDRSRPISSDPQLIVSGAFNEDGGHQAMRALLALSERPTAVFAANDLMAMGAMMAIRETGLMTPEDIAVVGFDDISGARLVYPALTTIRQFQHRMGQQAAEMLLERMSGQAVQHGRSVSMPYELVVRDSAWARRLGAQVCASVIFYQHLLQIHRPLRQRLGADQRGSRDHHLSGSRALPGQLDRQSAAAAAGSGTNAKYRFC